jgi:hypothetical protein
MGILRLRGRLRKRERLFARFLLMAQGDHGVDADRAPRGYVAGGGGDSEKHSDSSGQRERIGCAHTEKQRGKALAERERSGEANHNPERSEFQSLRENAANNISLVRAKRDTHSYFFCVLRDRKRQQRVNS